MRDAPIKKKKSIVLRFAIVAFCAYAVVSLFQLRNELAGSRQELSELEAEAAKQKNENDELSRLLDGDEKSKITERAVREKLDYIYEGEQVFTDISGKTGR